MLESILMEAGASSLNLTMKGMLICMACSLMLGLIISCAYMICSEKYTKNFVITIVILPVLVQAVIAMVNGNLGIGVAIVGAFSLVRFRSLPGTSKDIATIFFTMAVGIATGMGFVGFAALFTVVVAAVFIVLSKTGFGEIKSCEKHLKVVIPENLNYKGLFDDIFEKYADEVKLDRVKTTNLGSLFEVNYLIKLKDDADEKSMIDEIRTRNGNLTVACGSVSQSAEEL